MFSPVLKFSGLSVSQTDLSQRNAWVYIVFCYKQKLLYIGETYDSEGVFRRLSSHFGPYAQSTLKQNANDIARKKILSPPYLIVACNINSNSDDSFDSSAKKIRLKIEADLHQFYAQTFLVQNPGWNIISTASQTNITNDALLDNIVNSLYVESSNAFSHFKELSSSSPWNFIVLERPVPETNDKYSLWEIIERIEVTLFRYVIEQLKLVGENWWSESIPEPIRIECVRRREQEKSHEFMPPEAYLGIIELREIIRKNWLIFESLMSNISLNDGKEKATKWLVEVNDARKILAHPLKMQYLSISKEKEVNIRRYFQTLQEKT